MKIDPSTITPPPRDNMTANELAKFWSVTYSRARNQARALRYRVKMRNRSKPPRYPIPVDGMSISELAKFWSTDKNTTWGRVRTLAYTPSAKSYEYPAREGMSDRELALLWTVDNSYSKAIAKRLGYKRTINPKINELKYPESMTVKQLSEFWNVNYMAAWRRCQRKGHTPKKKGAIKCPKKS